MLHDNIIYLITDFFFGAPLNFPPLGEYLSHLTLMPALDLLNHYSIVVQSLETCL